MSEFRSTYEFYQAMLPIKFPIDWERWMLIHDDKKAAALYVNFYKEIALAWSKCKNIYTEDEIALFEVIQVLIKNVPIIMESESKFRSAYVYRIAYNAILGITRRYKVRKAVMDHLVSDMSFTDDNGTLRSIFDILPDPDSDPRDLVGHRDKSAKLWNVIQDLPDDYVEVIEAIISHKHCETVSPADRRKIILNLREILKDSYADYFGDDEVESKKTIFKDVVKKKSVVSITVKMPDGNFACYFGENKIVDGIKYVMFFGADQDYEVLYDRAKWYEVMEVEEDEK